ncbi:hypothetical protein KFL_009200100, partial [Klebsormidium nitens]
GAAQPLRGLEDRRLHRLSVHLRRLRL